MIFSKLQIDRAFSAVNSKSTPVTSRLENEKYGFCPYCHQKMREVFCKDHHVLLCDQDRAVFPVKDEDCKEFSPTAVTPSLDLNNISWAL